MTRTEVPFDDMPDEVLVTASQIKELTGFYPTRMHFGELSARHYNMKQGTWRLKKGVWYFWKEERDDGF